MQYVDEASNGGDYDYLLGLEDAYHSIKFYNL